MSGWRSRPSKSRLVSAPSRMTSANGKKGHLGAKNSRAVWMGEQDRVATTGFSKMSDRQLGLWDIKVPNQPIGGFKFLDSISGVCMPFWDDGNKILYLAGKG
jgi:coronin-1B/1C/6